MTNIQKDTSNRSIIGTHDFYEVVVRGACESYLNNTCSTSSAIFACIGLHHIKEYLRKEYNISDMTTFNTDVNARSGVLAICRDIANAGKHSGLDNNAGDGSVEFHSRTYMENDSVNDTEHPRQYVVF
jgi:hypothetical protein